MNEHHTRAPSSINSLGIVPLPVYAYKLRLRALTSGAVGPAPGNGWRGALGHALLGLACAAEARRCPPCQAPTRCDYAALFAPIARDGQAPLPPWSIAFEGADVLDEDVRTALSVHLFGQAHHLAKPLLAAFERAAASGIGPDRVRFALEGVCARGPDGCWSDVAAGEAIQSMSLPPSPGNTLEIHLCQPFRGKYRSRLIGPRELSLGHLVRSGLRRLEALSRSYADSSLEASTYDARAMIAKADSIEAHDRQLRWQENTRHSARQGSSMQLGGIVGSLAYSYSETTPLLALLNQFVDTHIGKGATMGMGQIKLATSSSQHD